MSATKQRSWLAIVRVHACVRVVRRDGPRRAGHGLLLELRAAPPLARTSVPCGLNSRCSRRAPCQDTAREKHLCNIPLHIAVTSQYASSAAIGAQAHRPVSCRTADTAIVIVAMKWCDAELLRGNVLILSAVE